MTKYQIGDKVKFLNAIGGGVVVRIEGPVIFVRDETGFDMPMAQSDLIRMADMQGAGKVFNQSFDGLMPSAEEIKMKQEQDERDRKAIEEQNRRLMEKFGSAADGDEDIEALRDENKRLKSQINNLKDQIKRLQEQLSHRRQPESGNGKEGFFAKYVTKPGYAEIDLHIEALHDAPSTLNEDEMLGLQMSHFRQCLNYALLNGMKKVVFIHGVGRGVLKNEIQKELKQYKQLSYMDAPINRYGVGATEVYFKTTTK